MEKKYGVPWQNCLMMRDHNLSLNFANGWVHGRVKNVELTQADYDLVDQLAASSSDYTVNSGSSGTYWWQWKDSNNFDYLKETTSDTILQAFIGIWPYRLRHWYQWPDLTPGKLDQILVDSVPSKTTIGYWNGVPDVGSPYENPTNLTEVFIPPDMTLKHGLFNPEADAVKPAFKLIINRMDMDIFDPDTSRGKAKINKIMEGRTITRKWKPGIQAWNYSTQANLGVQPTEWLQEDDRRVPTPGVRTVPGVR